jgi:hypothetical protein
MSRERRPAGNATGTPVAPSRHYARKPPRAAAAYPGGHHRRWVRLRVGRGRGGTLISAKQRRMPLIALNGLLVLLPAALYLDAKASAGELDAYFYAVQALELIFAVVQFRLLGLNARAGMRISRKGVQAAAVG